MNHTDETPAETMSPAEYAELARDARELVTAVERATRCTGAVFVAALGLTIAATALGLPVVGEVTAVVAVAAFTAALVMLMARIGLGPMPPEATADTALDASSTPPSASDGTSTTNGGISRI